MRGIPLSTVSKALKFGLLGHVWSIYGEFFKPGLLVTAPGPTVDENDPTPFRHRGGLISHPPGGRGGRGAGGVRHRVSPIIKNDLLGTFQRAKQYAVQG